MGRMPRILRLVGWIHIVLATALAAVGLASVVTGPLVSAGERTLAGAAVVAGWILAAAVGAALLGFARLVGDVRTIRDRLEERPADGLQRHAFEPLDMGLLHSPTGVSVHSAAADGLGARVGLRRGDLITAVNGTRLTTFATHEERVNAIAYSRPARLTVLRDEGEVAVTLR